MNNYTVSWSNECEAKLIELWLDSGDTEAITKSCNRIDALLATDPMNCGREKHEGLREMREPPLRVLYEISPDDRLVQVVGLRLVGV